MKRRTVTRELEGVRSPLQLLDYRLSEYDVWNSVQCDSVGPDNKHTSRVCDTPGPPGALHQGSQYTAPHSALRGEPWWSCCYELCTFFHNFL